MMSLRSILLGVGVVVLAASLVGYLAFSTPKPATIFVGLIGLSLIAFSNAIKALNHK